MTKKHFIALANNNQFLLNKAILSRDENYLRGMMVAVRSTAGMLKELHSKFDVKKYLEASGMTNAITVLNSIRAASGKKAIKPEVYYLVSSNELKQI